jgi:alcohol dehydrogenase (cytochrome c)
VAVTGGDVVLTGEITGHFLVFDAQNGRILYKHDVGGRPGLVCYAAGGRQYVAMMAAASTRSKLLG